MLHQDQLDDIERCALVAELMVLRLTERHLHAGPAAAPFLDVLVERALVEARRPLKRKRSTPVDTHLQAVTNSAEAYVEEDRDSLDAVTLTAAERFLKAAKSEVQGFTCTACGHGSLLQCSASMPIGNVPVARCLHELAVLCDWAIRLASDLYKRSLPLQHAIAPPRIVLSTIRGSSGRNRLVVDLGCSARCKLDGLQSKSFDAVVELVLDVGNLNVETMSALLYVFLHEVTVHAYQRIGAPKRETSHLDNFAEGWMDYVAEQLLRAAWFGSPVPPGVPVEWRKSNEPGLRLCEARRDVAGVKIGYEAAWRVFTALSSCAGPSERGLDLFHQLSCGLNVRQIDVNDRNSLVTRLAMQLPVDGETPVASSQPAWRVVANFAINKDIDAFLRDVLNL
jgi:hypothetical protein